MNSKWLIIGVIVLLIIILLLTYRTKLFGNIMSYDRGDNDYQFFLLSEFDSPMHRPEDGSLEGYTATKGQHVGSEMVKYSGRNNMKQSAMGKFDAARMLIENDWNKKNPLEPIKFRVNSGYRTAAHNKEVKGKDNSAHTKGYAADISTRGYTEAQINAILKALYSVGFRRIGVYNTFIHADNDPTLPTPADWNGDNYTGHLPNFNINDIPNLIA